MDLIIGVEREYEKVRQRRKDQLATENIVVVLTKHGSKEHESSARSTNPEDLTGGGLSTR